VTTACTSRFQEVTKGSNALSLMDIWHWMPTALEKANSLLKPGEEKLHLPILVNEMTPGHDGEIWLTEQRRASTPKFAPNDQLTRKKYLESVYKRYSSVTLPLGPTEGFSLHAVFQPLELRRDPLAAEDLDRKKRRPLLGERLEDEKNADRFQSHRHEKERADEKQRPVIAKNGEDALTKSPQRRVVILGGPGTGKTTTLKHLTGCRAKEALTDPNAPIPIFLSLADLARSQKTLQSYLVDLVEELGIERTYAETLWKAIQDGQAFVCLDSLDEVEPRHQRRQKMIECMGH
jgi:DNA replication protein DnaC